MAQTVGEFFAQRLKEWGIRTIFGFPGDGINGVLEGLEKHREDFLLVQARHEEMAAFMACAYAKFSGELGVCLSTGGPGATHMITGLYDAKLDHMPVLAITGQASRSARGASRVRPASSFTSSKTVTRVTPPAASSPWRETSAGLFASSVTFCWAMSRSRT